MVQRAPGRTAIARRQVHADILPPFTESHPEVRKNKRAIVLAGPPGAGKSTAQSALSKETRPQPEYWLAINADDFKDELLEKAFADGSYDSHLMPKEVRDLEATGEKFDPRELAALAHNESSILSKKATNEAVRRGDNVIIDGTLGNGKQAKMLLDKLSSASYVHNSSGWFSPLQFCCTVRTLRQGSGVCSHPAGLGS